MLPDEWHLTQDVDDFLARAGDFLRSRAALHNTPLTDLEKLRTSSGAAGRRDGTAVFGRLESEGGVRAVFYLTPPGRLGLTPLSAEQTGTLAARLASLGNAPAHVIADHATAGAFAKAWQRHTGVPSVPFWRTHLYRLGRAPRAGAAAPPERTAGKSSAGAVSSASTSGSGTPST